MLEQLQGTTAWVTLGFIVLMIMYDVYAYIKGGTEGTISYMIVMNWSKYPAFTFAVGFLMGHLFWPLATCQ